MKLNKKGWGTIEMILLSLGLLIALIVAAFFISKLYGNLGNSIGNKVYMDLETRIETAASNYIRENNISVSGEYRLSLTTLKNGYINEFKDKDGNECDGYVMINNVNGVNYYRGYIMCDNYQTENY